MKIWKRIRLLAQRRQFEEDLAEEMRIHREMAAAALGSDAARAFGSAAMSMEDSRAVWGFGRLDSWRQDLRYAVRGFRKTPAFALTVIGTIGLALGLNTTVFSVFNAYLLKPHAVRDPYGLYLVHLGYGEGSRSQFHLAGISGSVPPEGRVQRRHGL
jgi:hypothetical protein